MALRALAPGGVVVCAGIHMSDIPSFAYADLWGERQIRSVANLTRRDGEEFLALAADAGVRARDDHVLPWVRQITPWTSCARVGFGARRCCGPDRGGADGGRDREAHRGVRADLRRRDAQGARRARRDLVRDPAPAVAARTRSAIPSTTTATSGQEEVYIALDGQATLTAAGEQHLLEPGVYARVGPSETRKVATGESRPRSSSSAGRPGRRSGHQFTEEGEPDPFAASP